MDQFFLAIYRWFSTRKGIFALFLLTILAALALIASRLQMEEDITRMIPANEKVKKMNFVFQNAKFADQLVVHVYASDSNQIENPEALMAFSDSLVHKIESNLGEYVETIRHRVDQNQISEVYDLFFNNLPIFLEPEDYVQLDSQMTSAEIESRVRYVYTSLLSPASFVLKKYLLQDPLTLTPVALKKLEELQLDEQLSLHEGYIMSQEKTSLLLFIRPVYPASETNRNAEFIDGLDEAIEQTVAESNVKVNADYFGGAAVSVANARRIKIDVTLTVTIAMTALVIFISLFFRRATVFLILFIPVVFGGLTALAFLYLLKTQVSLVALGIGSVLLGISIDFSLHIFSHYRKTGNVERVIADLSLPVLMSALTTMTAFLCLLIVRAEALHDLGIFAGISVLSSAFFALLILPHFLSKSTSESSSQPSPNTFLDRLSAFPVDRSKIILGLIAVLTLVFLFTSGKVRFEKDLMNMNYVTDKLKAAESRLDQVIDYKLKSVYLIASGPDLTTALQNNERIASQIASLKSEGIIKKYSSVSNLLLSDSLQKVRIQEWNNFWTPERKKRVKEELITASSAYKLKPTAFNKFFSLLDREFEPISPESLGEIKRMFLDEFISESPQLTTVTTVLNVAHEDKTKVYEAFESVDGITILDKQYLTSAFADILKEDFDLLVLVSLLLVFTLIFHAFGRIELALITFLPMLISWVWTLGIMGLFGITFNIFNIIIATFIFGLGIDYSIFIMRGLVQAYKYGREELPSYKTAILLSALTTVTGMGVLILAQHPALRSIALLSMIGVLSVVVVSFTLEPMLFRWLVKRSDGEPRMSPITLWNVFTSIFGFSLFLIGVTILSIVITLFKILPIPVKKAKLWVHTGLMYFARFLVWIMANVKNTLVNPQGETFDKSAIIVCNHQSHMDLLMVLILHPKLIILTNDWVYNNPYYGKIVKYLDFYPVSGGVEVSIDQLKERMDEGYSIVIFPEGTRSVDCKIKRFKKGAFYLAEQLNADIVPVLLHGIGHFMNKGENYVKDGSATIRIMDRITPDNEDYGVGYSPRTKQICAAMRKEFENIRLKAETPEYFKNRLIKNYLYKGPIISWYFRVKIRLEKNYAPFHELLPQVGHITDVGCGYGFMSYMLSFLAEGRTLLGIDLDEEKIAVANHCISKHKDINFVAGDVATYQMPESDAFILSDVLHYLTPNEQKGLIRNCLDQLRPGGRLIIRDGNTEMEKRHEGTKLTEWFSTKLLKFNLTKHGKLFFLSKEDIFQAIENHDVDIQVMDNTLFTSNLIYIIDKPKRGIEQ